MKHFPWFIARRIVGKGSRFSGLIIRIAIAAIALSVAVMVLATCLISGFKTEIREKIFGFWGHIHIAHASISNILEVHPISQDQSFFPHLDTLGPVQYEVFGTSSNWSLSQQQRTKGGIAHIQSIVIKPGILQTREELEGIVAKGIGPEFDWQFLEEALVAGQRIAFNDSLASRELLVSKTTADRLRLQLEDKVRIVFVEKGKQLPRRFTVKGIYNTGLDDYDKKFVLVDRRVLQEVYGWSENQVSTFEVFVEELEDIPIFSDYITQEWLPLELYAETIRGRDPAIFDWLDLQDVNEGVILMLMVIVGIVNTITALLILILERTTMIGVLKSLGTTNFRIQQIFLINAGYIILAGMCLGNFLGFGLAFLQDHFQIIGLSEADYYLSYAPIDWNWPRLITINIGTFLVTLLCLLLPSYLVASIDPVKSIRFN